MAGLIYKGFIVDVTFKGDLKGGKRRREKEWWSEKIPNTRDLATESRSDFNHTPSKSPG